MATNGLISVMSSDSGASCEVYAKIVAGCDGYNVIVAAASIIAVLATGEGSLQEIWRAARNSGFGCDDCLHVIGANRDTFSMSGDDIPQSYLATIQNPEWNPRWVCGLTEYFEEIRIDTCHPFVAHYRRSLGESRGV